MVVLTLECTGDDSGTATAEFVLPAGVTFSTATLHSVDVNVAGSVTMQTWTKAETDDLPAGPRDVYAPLYIALRPFCDRGEIMTMTDNTLGHDLIPLGTAEPLLGAHQNPRVRDLVIARGSRTLAAGTEVLTNYLDVADEGAVAALGPRGRAKARARAIARAHAPTACIDTHTRARMGN
jgi:hypothetical protein